MSLQSRMNFRNDLDNESEDNISDDELVAKVKVFKLNCATERADIITEHTAIQDIV